MSYHSGLSNDVSNCGYVKFTLACNSLLSPYRRVRTCIHQLGSSSHKCIKIRKRMTELLRTSKIPRIDPTVAKYCRFEKVWFFYPKPIFLGLFIGRYLRIRRLLSPSGRLLSHKRIKIIKYTIRAAQNIKNFYNRPNSRKVMVFKNYL